MKEPPFFLVWCEDGGEPRVKQIDLHAAKREAERLARLHPGQSFCVMVPVARFTERRVEVEHFDPSGDGVPF